MTTSNQTNEQPDERAELIAALRSPDRWMKLTDDQCDKAAALLESDAPRPAMKPLPVEGSEEADAAIYAVLKERNFPGSTLNAGRAGWRAARLYGIK